MRKIWGVSLTLVLLAVAACGPAPTVTPIPPYQVTFDATIIAVQPGGDTLIELGLSNVGSVPVPSSTFTAAFELRGPDDALRASGTAVLPPASPSDGETQTVIGWNGPLDAGEYELSWGAPDLGSTVVEFEIVARGDNLYLGEEMVTRSGPGYPRPDSPMGN